MKTRCAGSRPGSDAHTVSNAKGIYIDLLTYFSKHQDKLFVAITAPPLIDGTYGAHARAFNNWLVNDWLAGYPYANVAVFDFYTVLTSNGGNANKNDLGAAAGNHHRLYNGAIQHLDEWRWQTPPLIPAATITRRRPGMFKSHGGVPAAAQHFLSPLERCPGSPVVFLPAPAAHLEVGDQGLTPACSSRL